jgi:hypothetical protein
MTGAVSFENVAGGGSTRNIDLAVNVDYTPLKQFSAMLRTRYNSRKGGGEDISHVDLIQTSRYDFYPSFYTGRPILQLEEEFQYSQDSIGAETGWVRLLARYFPYSRLSFAGSTTQNIIGGAQQIYSLSANLNMKYFQTNLDYTYGRRSSDQRIDKRFAASVRRSF